jgi:hypothetical protein
LEAKEIEHDDRLAVILLKKTFQFITHERKHVLPFPTLIVLTLELRPAVVYYACDPIELTTSSRPVSLKRR